MERIELVILRSLLYNDNYVKRVLPFLKDEYFDQLPERRLFKEIHAFVMKFTALPTKESLMIDLDQAQGVAEDTFELIVEILNACEAEKDNLPNEDWLVEATEKWCQERAIEIAVLNAIEIIQEEKTNKNAKTSRGAIPKILSDALAVSFDSRIGHDYIEDSDGRYDFYHLKESKIPFRLEKFNLATKNGIPNKTLNVCLAGTGVGKSLFMCDLAAHYLKIGKRVLYITLEMAEERIAERIDANLMDSPLDNLILMSQEAYKRKIDALRGTGQLIIKEYPTASAHAGHFRHFIDELAMKKGFRPDVIFIDYLNICASSRIKSGGDGLYQYVKSIAEELRGLAVEVDVPIWTATQTNRQGFASSDPDLTNTSESFGLPATADFMFALVTAEELEQLHQLKCIILKNRYGSLHENRKFVIGVDRSRMRLYDVEQGAQDELADGKKDYKADKTKSGVLADDEDDDTPPFDIDNPQTPAPEPPSSGGSMFTQRKKEKKRKKPNTNGWNI